MLYFRRMRVDSMTCIIKRQTSRTTSSSAEEWMKPGNTWVTKWGTYELSWERNGGYDGQLWEKKIATTSEDGYSSTEAETDVWCLTRDFKWKYQARKRWTYEKSTHHRKCRDSSLREWNSSSLLIIKQHNIPCPPSTVGSPGKIQRTLTISASNAERWA